MNIESVKTTSTPPQPLEGAARTPPRASAAPAKVIELAANQKPTQAESQKQDAAHQKISVEDAVKRLADFVAPTNSEISFSIDEESGTRVVKILDSESKKVLRQFPSEEAIQIAHALDKLQGLFVKEKV